MPCSARGHGELLEALLAFEKPPGGDLSGLAIGDVASYAVCHHAIAMDAVRFTVILCKTAFFESALAILFRHLCDVANTQVNRDR